jgi:hypothetical protein
MRKGFGVCIIRSTEMPQKEVLKLRTSLSNEFYPCTIVQLLQEVIQLTFDDIIDVLQGTTTSSNCW